MTEVATDALIEALDRAVPAPVRTISRVLAEAGHRSWIVGGCVRDVALTLAFVEEKPVLGGDWDMATDAEPEQVQKLFKRVIPTGLEHGTVTIVIGREHYEITTLRGEKGHSDGRRPDEVFYVTDLDEDLARRDFTVNAMAYAISARTFHDPFSGLSDLCARKLRAVGEPARRFSEDGLRVLRCARFSATLNFDIEEQTAAQIAPSLSSFEKVALERVRVEWFKALGSAHPSRFLKTVLEHGMLAITAPQLFATPQSTDRNQKDMGELMSRLDSMPARPLLRLAFLICSGADPELTRDERGALAAGLGAHFRLSREETATLRLLCQHGEPPAKLSAADASALRRYVASIGREATSEVCILQSWLAVDRDDAALCALHDRLVSIATSDVPLLVKDLAVSGKDLMDAGVPKGPLMGEFLRDLLELVLDDPTQNERSLLLSTVAERLKV